MLLILSSSFAAIIGVINTVCDGIFLCSKVQKVQYCFPNFFYQGLLVVTIALILTYTFITLIFMFCFELYIFIITNFLFGKTE